MDGQPSGIGTASSHLGATHRVIILVALLLFITTIHYSLSFQNELLHIVLGHLYILPILLAAFWFDVKGGLLVGGASALLFAPHIFIHWGHLPTVELSNFIEIALYLLTGFVTGLLSRGEKRQRMRYQESLARLDESHRKLKEQSDMLIRAEEQLRRADRLSALGELSAGMAHEIRNPLGAIKGTAEILQEDFSPGEQKYEFLQIMLKEISRLDRILSDFLMFARPARPELKDADLNRLIKSVVKLVERQAAKSNITISFETGTPITVKADEGLLTQAFLNLALNAVQAMPDGGTLAIRSEAEPTKEGKASICRISFTDTGVGISKENQKRLFNPFFTTKKEGTGLGLAIMHRIIEAHGGSISVESLKGSGSVFTVTLPAGGE